jgi:hypothetical protein
MKTLKNKQQSKKKMKGGYIGLYGCEVYNDRDEEDSAYDACIEEAEAREKAQNKHKIEHNLKRPARLVEKRSEDLKVDLSKVTTEETNFIQGVFNEMFLKSEKDGDTIFSNFLNKLRERKVYKQFIKKNKKQYRYININAGPPPSKTECYNHIKAIIIDFNNRVPPNDESLKLLKPENDFTSIFNFELIEACAKESLEDTRLIDYISQQMENYIGEYYIPDSDNKYSPLTRRFSHAYKNKYILFQIALAIINIVFLSDTNRTGCINVDNPENRFHKTLMKILLDMNPGAQISLPDSVSEPVKYDLGNAGPNEGPGYPAPEYAEARNDDEEEEELGGGRRTRKRKQQSKKKMRGGGGNNPQEITYIFRSFKTMFPAKENISNDVAIFENFLACTTERDVFKAFLNKFKDEKFNRRTIDQYRAIKNHAVSDCYEHIQGLIKFVNEEIINQYCIEEERPCEIMEELYKSPLKFKFISNCADKILFNMVKTNIEETKLNIDTIKAIINKEIPQFTSRFQTDQEVVPYNRYILFQIALEIINILFMNDSRFIAGFRRRKCNDINESNNLFHRTFEGIISCMNETVSSIDPNRVLNLGSDLGSDTDSSTETDSGIASLPPDNENLFGFDELKGTSSSGGRRTRKRKQKKNRKIRKTHKYRKIKKIRKIRK